MTALEMGLISTLLFAITVTSISEKKSALDFIGSILTLSVFVLVFYGIFRLFGWS